MSIWPISSFCFFRCLLQHRLEKVIFNANASHAAAVANVFFKLCRSRNDGNRAQRKVEISSSEAKIGRIEPERWKSFSKPTGKGDKWTILLCVGGENREADPNFREKTGLWFRSFETALPSHGFVYKKLRQTPQPPPPLQKNP